MTQGLGSPSFFKPFSLAPRGALEPTGGHLSPARLAVSGWGEAQKSPLRGTPAGPLHPRGSGSGALCCLHEPWLQDPPSPGTIRGKVFQQNAPEWKSGAAKAFLLLPPRRDGPQEELWLLRLISRPLSWGGRRYSGHIQPFAEEPSRARGCLQFLLKRRRSEASSLPWHWFHSGNI